MRPPPPPPGSALAIGGSLECHNVIANGGYGRPCNGSPTTTTIKLMLVFLWRVWHLSNMKHLFTPRLNADLCFLFALHKLMDVPFRRFVTHSEKLSGRNYVYLYTPPPPPAPPPSPPPPPPPPRETFYFATM